MSKLSAPIDQAAVKRSFTKPEKTEPTNFIRREIAARMAERLDLIKLQPKVIVDAGCGAGADLLRLQDRYADSRVIGIDASAGMLAQAAALLSQNQLALTRLMPKWLGKALQGGPDIELSCADFARTPLTSQSVDFVWSNLALLWHAQPDLVFAEWRRILQVDGLLMFSSFGPDTFIEVRQAFVAVDDYPHTLPFVDMHDLGDMLVHAGFSTPVMDMEKIYLTYQEPEQLLREVAAFGGNPLLSKRQGLLGKQAWQQVLQALNAQRKTDGRLHLTLEVIYGHAFRAPDRKTASGESIIQFDALRKPPGSRLS